MVEAVVSETTLPPPQQADPQENQSLQPPPPPPPYETVTEPERVSVKAEPLDDDQLDFVFATEVLSSWNANEESDAELWKRMESLVCSQYFPRFFGTTNARIQKSCTSAPSWEVFCEKHRSRFEHFFANKQNNR